MGDFREDIAFLARSANRLRVIQLLADGPETRAELQESAAVSRATLGRILSDFRSRDWVVREGDRYRTTPLGSFLADEFTDLLERAANLQRLQGIVRWLPTEEMDFEFRRLATADVVRPRPTDPTAPLRRGAERLCEADRPGILAGFFAFEDVEPKWRAIAEEGGSCEIVTTPPIVDAITAETTLAAHLGELLETDQVEFYVHDDPIPYLLFLLDESVAIAARDGEGRPRGLVESDDDAVVSWATETFESYRERAEHVDGRDIEA